MPSRGSESKSDLERMHTPEAIRGRLVSRRRPSYLSDFIYGAIDGAVTTFAIVSGVEGAKLEVSIVIILGAANVIADGFSMAAANFLGTRAEGQQRQQARRVEEREIRVHPAGEREEIRQIFAGKGFSGDILEQIVDVITSDPKRWVDTMMSEEHGLAQEPRSPLRAALATFVAFLVIGAIPLLPYLSGLDNPFVLSIAMTGGAFFAVGAFKSRFVEQRWWLSGLETLAVGGVAAMLAYVVGVLLKGVA